MKKLVVFIILCCFSFECFSQRKLELIATPGDTYFLNSGSDVQITIKGGGSNTRPFKVIGSKKGSTLNGNSFIKVLGNNIIVENIEFSNNKINYSVSRGLISLGDNKRKVDNVTLDGIKVVGRNSFESYDGKTQFHFLYINGNNVKVVNSIFRNKNNRLPIIHVDAGLNNVSIQNCVFRDVIEPKNDIGLEAIRVGLGHGRTMLTINNNDFLNYFGDSETISIKCDGVKVINNSFLNTRSGVSLRYGSDCMISGNIFENVYTPIRLSGRNITIKDNIFKNKNNRSIFFMFGGENYLQVSDVLITNNTFWGYFNLYGTKVSGHTLNPMRISIKDNVLKKGNITSKIKNESNSFFNANEKKLVKTSLNSKVKEYILK